MAGVDRLVHELLSLLNLKDLYVFFSSPFGVTKHSHLTLIKCGLVTPALLSTCSTQNYMARSQLVAFKLVQMCWLNSWSSLSERRYHWCWPIRPRCICQSYVTCQGSDDIQNNILSSRNQTWKSSISICHFGWYVQHSFLTQCHLSDQNIPALIKVRSCQSLASCHSTLNDCPSPWRLSSRSRSPEQSWLTYLDFE